MPVSAEHVDPARRPATPAELRREVVPDQPVLLVGDELTWRASGVIDWLESNKWSWTSAADAERAKWLAAIQKISLVMVTGERTKVWAVVEAVRPVTMAPMVVIAPAKPESVVSLVSAGVDAVVDTSSGPDELFARVTGLLRRSDHGWEPGVRHLIAGELVVDLWAQECRLTGEKLALSPTEYSLLTFLMTHPQQALTTNTIVRRVWGWLPTDGRNTLRIFVNRLRRKLGDDPRHPQFIASVRGTGYRFIRNVAEVGDDVERAVPRIDVRPLLESVEQLATELVDTGDAREAAERMLTLIDATGYADAMSVFEVDSHTMRMVASRHMPSSWVDAVGSGLRLDAGFASAQSVLRNEPVQFADVSTMAEQYGPTVERLAPHGFAACLFLPIVRGPVVWGHLGLARRSRQPFDSSGTVFLRAMCAVFALGLDDMDPKGEAS